MPFLSFSKAFLIVVFSPHYWFEFILNYFVDVDQHF